MDTLKPIIASIIDVVCFEGNGYTDEWKEEAARRGLDVETSVPEMFKAFTSPSAVKMFTSTGVYTEKELIARNEVKWEIYTKKVQIEARVLGRMATNHIIPAAIKYKSRLLKELAANKEVFGDISLCSTELEIVREISALISEVNAKVDAMVEARKAANKITDEYGKAVAYHEIAESLNAMRRSINSRNSSITRSGLCQNTANFCLSASCVNFSNNIAVPGINQSTAFPFLSTKSFFLLYIEGGNQFSEFLLVYASVKHYEGAFVIGYCQHHETLYNICGGAGKHTHPVAFILGFHKKLVFALRHKLLDFLAHFAVNCLVLTAYDVHSFQTVDNGSEIDVFVSKLECRDASHQLEHCRRYIYRAYVLSLRKLVVYRLCSLRKACKRNQQHSCNYDCLFHDLLSI